MLHMASGSRLGRTQPPTRRDPSRPRGDPALVLRRATRPRTRRSIPGTVRGPRPRWWTAERVRARGHQT